MIITRTQVIAHRAADHAVRSFFIINVIGGGVHHVRIGAPSSVKRVMPIIRNKRIVTACSHDDIIDPCRGRQNILSVDMIGHIPSWHIEQTILVITHDLDIIFTVKGDY